MDFYLPALLLGLVQGLTEFLPVSSTAHLAVIPRALGWTSPLLTSLPFDVALHAGTLAALLAVFGREWITLVRALVRPGSADGRVALGLVLSTIPALGAGALLEHRVGDAMRTPGWIAVWLAAGAVALWWADRQPEGRRTGRDLTMREALLIGCAQACAILPGLSRSGMTMTAGRLVGLSRAESARYSFLMSAPVIGAAIMWESRHLTSLSAPEGTAVLLGVAAAGAAGAATIRWLLRAVGRMGYTPFVAYRLALAAVLTAFLR